MIPFFGRRNQVYPAVRKDRIVVEKHFMDREDWARERELYEAVQLPHPRLLEAREGTLVTEYCRCPTLLDELESQEREGFRAAPWEALAKWMTECVSQNGILPEEGNLRNYLWDADRSVVLGLDFESYRPISLADSAANLIAALLEYEPPDTTVKQQAAEILNGLFQVDPETIANARTALRQRRQDHHSQPVSGILLAGGRSSRMGTDKAELMLGGRSLMEWQVQKLQSLGIRDILVSGNYAVPHTKSVTDELPGRGPLGGIYSCLRAAQNDRCLVLSVDTPLVPASALYHLCRAHKRGITVLRHGNFQEPLLGVYDRNTADAAYDLLTKGGASVRALQACVDWSGFDYKGPEAFLLNCNTPQEFDCVHRILAFYRANGVELL